MTGGSRGIGASVVRGLAARGCEVVFLYHQDHAAARKLARETGATAICCDVSDREEVREVIRSGRAYSPAAQRASIPPEAWEFDIVVCNAGVSLTGLFTDMTGQEWETLRGVNLDGVINTLQEVIPAMVSRKSGSIVLVSSMWGRCGASCEAAYSATKAAVIGLTKSLAKELGPSGIRVNCVAPGVIDTDMNRNLSEADRESLREETPLMRIGAPEDVAEAVLFLASEKASFITGQVLGVDGGFVI